MPAFSFVAVLVKLASSQEPQASWPKHCDAFAACTVTTHFPPVHFAGLLAAGLGSTMEGG